MHLLYIWAPHLQKDISALEKVQCTAARYAINNYSWRSRVTTMLNSLDWPTLKSRCLYSKLVMFYKIINGHIEVPSLSLIPIHTSTRGHSQHFRPPYARLNTYLFSFVPLTIKLFVNQPSLSNFLRIPIFYVLYLGNHWSLHICMILHISVHYTLYRVLHSK